jgi:hypothetical protein
MPGRTTVVRPGFIVGPDDPTGRFTYWPVRFGRGGEIAVPGNPTDPVQVIDVRDLGAWLVHVVERGTHTWSNARALAEGLRFRPVEETVRDTLAWYRTQTKEADGRVKLALSPEDEAKVLAAWRDGHGASGAVRSGAVPPPPG